MLKSGEILDQKYRIVKLLGRGGSGYVYLAENIKIGKKWAIKEIDCKKESRDYLYAEVEILKKLDHPSMPTVVDLIEQGGFLYIVENYFEGVTLKQIIASQQFCSEQNVIKWARQLCDILKYLHDFKPNAIIYRDMKPANVIIDKDNNAKLVDLGIAREYKTGQDGDTVYIGTRGYAAPEQYSGSNQTDARTDIYGLGATLYHALTGLNPAEPPYQMAPVTEVNKNVSKKLEKIINKCTKNDPTLRYQSVDELLEELTNMNKDINRVQEPNNNVNRCMSSKLVFIGSLSHRAGSSFVAANLAAMLASSGLSVSVIEFPINIPYFFDALFISKKTEIKQFISCAHEVKKGHPINKNQAFIDSGVAWYILDPTKSPVYDWTLADTMQLIYSVKQTQIILVDLSVNWTHSSIHPILSQADNLFVVVDPDPVLIDRTERIEGLVDMTDKLNVPVELKTMNLLTKLKAQTDCDIDFIINKYTECIDVDHLCLPIRPITKIPYFEPLEVYRSLWEGSLLYYNSQFRDTFNHHFSPLVRRLTQTDQLSGKSSACIGMICRIKTFYNTFLKKKGEVF